MANAPQQQAPQIGWHAWHTLGVTFTKRVTYLDFYEALVREDVPFSIAGEQSLLIFPKRLSFQHLEKLDKLLLPYQSDTSVDIYDAGVTSRRRIPTRAEADRVLNELTEKLRTKRLAREQQP